MKKLLLLLLCMPLIGLGQTDTTEYYWDEDSVMMIKCVGDCENGFGERSAEVPNSCTTSQYTGFFKNGKFDGEGSYYIATAAGGCKYVGEWKNGKRHGEGVYTSDNGTVKKGLWENGEFIGKE